MTHEFVSTPTHDPYERGHEFGAANAAQLAATLATYGRIFGAGGVTTEQSAALGGQALARVAEWAPDLTEEIRGIAAGAGLAAADVAAVNARTEIIARYWGGAGTGRGECTTVVALGGDATVAAQNWDWYGSMADHWLLWTIPYPDGRRVTTLTEFGIVGKIGINDRGVGTLFNILHHAEDGGAMAVPVHLVARRILDSAASVADAVRITKSAPVCASTAITTVDGRAAVSMELWPGGLGEVAPGADGVLLRTNHFLTAEARPGDIGPAFGSDTMDRYGYLSQSLTGRPGVTADDVFAALRDHTAGVCCHPAPGADPEHDYATLATVRLDLAARTLHATAGQPCTH